MPDKFKEFLVSDLAHADVFNEKVYVPGEENRKKLDQHLADETNPHETSMGNLVDNVHDNTYHNPNYAECPHGNECHDPDFLPLADAYVHPPTVQCNAITGFTDTEIIMHGNEWHTEEYCTDCGGGGEMAIHGNEYHNPNFADISVGDRTYYINNSGGSDSNAGTSAGTAWKTWAKFISVLPRVILHEITVYIVGNYSGQLVIENRQISGKLTIAGFNVASLKETVSNGIQVINCSAFYENFRIYNLKTTGSNIHIRGSSCVHIDRCEPLYSHITGAVRVTENAVAFVEGCNLGSGIVRYGLKVRNGGTIISLNNTGVAIEYGLSAYSGTIFKDGTQPTGSVANEHNLGGGQIF